MYTSIWWSNDKRNSTLLLEISLKVTCKENNVYYE